MLRESFIASHGYDQYIVEPDSTLASGPAMLLTPHGASHYNELESTVRIRLNGNAEWSFSYVYSKARGDLNTLSQLFVPFEQPVIRPDAYSYLDVGRSQPHFELGKVQDSRMGNRGGSRD